MELRHLRYFVAVADEEHITRAAARLGIQQPPLSQQIRALETELDVQLLRRKPRGIELTDAGRAFAADARDILARAADAVARAQRIARGEQGAIVLGFTSSAPFHPFVPHEIRAFREANPRVSLALEEGGTGDLVEAVRSERMDAAFIRSPVPDREGLAIRPLFEEPMLAALPEGHSLTAEADRPLGLAELEGAPFVLYRRHSGPGLYDSILAACHRAGIAPNIAQEAPRIVATLNLVAAGVGITLVPESLRQSQLRGVVYRTLKPRDRFTAPINLVSRAVEHSATARRFVDQVRRAAREMRAEGA